MTKSMHIQEETGSTIYKNIQNGGRNGTTGSMNLTVTRKVRGSGRSENIC